MRHGSEQEFWDIRVLTAQKYFSFILTKHQWSHLTGERVSPYKGVQTLRFETVNSRFITENVFLIPQDWEINQIQKN